MNEFLFLIGQKRANTACTRPPAKYAGAMVVGLPSLGTACAFSGSLCGLKLVPSKWLGKGPGGRERQVVGPTSRAMEFIVKSFDGEIEVVEINDHLAFFYWGRHQNHKMMDMQLGGGSFAIYRGNSAIVVDTMTQPGQGEWVKQYLEKTHAIKLFTVVNTHWHLDHIIDNRLYKDGIIIGHSHTRKIMQENQKAFESGDFEDYPAFSVVPPNLTFEGRLDLWLDDLKVELHEFLVHAKGHIGVILPDDKIFIAGDILEDPIWIFDFDFASPEIQLAEFERLMTMDIERILPSHGSLGIIKAGGYNKNFIRNNEDYLRSMLGDTDNPDFLKKSAQDYIGNALKLGELIWWEPYAKVHELNKSTIKKLK